jgi:steroid delta-isomerase-like uncharacterized protein
MADGNSLAHRFNGEILSQGKVEVIDEIVADDYVEHQAFPGLPSGKAGLYAFVKMFRDAFPDLNVETLAAVTEGDELWAYAQMTGTHKGDFAGIPATGKKVSVTMFDRVRIRDGKAIEHWGVSDDLGMMTQLGVVPDMG